jgi:molecular chaperone DnaK
MVQEAQQYAEEDRRKRTEAETRNQADSLVYTAQKLLEEQGDKVPADLKQEVEGKIAALRTAVQQNDMPQIQSGMNELNASLQKMGQAVYGQQGAGPESGTPPGDSGQGPGGDSPGGTVEGEYREI